MGRRRKGDAIHGWINLNKPSGLSSMDAVSKVRHALNAQKAGHAGTLDPLATGVLPIALGEATKTVEYAQDSLKTYGFTVTWGEERNTDDLEGEIVQQSVKRPTEKDIHALLPQFTGEIEQAPPAFSAIKIDGQRAYKKARDGENFEIEKRPVYIEEFDLIQHQENQTSFECLCGKGTYIRSLARDMGRILGCFGYISALERIEVGTFHIKDVISLDKFENFDHSALSKILLPVETMLDDIPALFLKEQEAIRLKQGQRLSFIAKPDFERLKIIGLGIPETREALVKLHDTPIGIVDIKGPNIQPRKIFNL